MLLELTIQNILHIEAATISFKEGLYVLTGETGAGKTALIQALHLCLGQSISQSIIKPKASKAYVQALFLLDSKVEEFLKEHGIEYDKSEPLIIRRELSSEGKSRSLINGQISSKYVLSKLAPLIIETIGQDASHNLLSSSNQRELLDLYGGHDLSEYTSLYLEDLALRKKLDELSSKLEKKDQILERLRHTLKEIEDVNLFEAEESELEQKHRKLFDNISLYELKTEIDQTLDRVLTELAQIKQKLLKTPDHLLQEPKEHIDSAQTSINEAQYQLAIEEPDTEELNRIEERLSIIHPILKRFGPTYQDVQKHKEELQKEISSIETLDQEHDTLFATRSKLTSSLSLLAHKLKEERKKTASRLSIAILKKLEQLNLPHAQFTINISDIAPSRFGTETIDFCFCANKGQSPKPLSNVASSGERSRILLAIKALLIDLSDTSTLLFDEIDANIGGQTASLVADLLKEMAEKKQVIAITHFPQVAKKADHHLCVEKIHHDTDTSCTITLLSNKAKKTELTRMLGGP